ncbi:MAG TPA: FAD-binding oxidoreductase [Acidimicrobiales bacterium]|nr:FAD-binding oxidoreductase [Acidimicrobiales bacterium]
MTRSRWPVPGQSREAARVKLKPGNFQGTPPKGRSVSAELAAIDVVDERWFDKSRYRRLARVVANEALTTTGTFRVRLEVADGEPFEFRPGQFVGVEAEFAGRGFRRSPYCILSDPADAPGFDLLVRAVPHGPLSLYLADLEPGDEVIFRGPTGRSMVPRDLDRELVLMATGTGVAPLVSLARHLLAGGYPQAISLWWGLRLVDDICLTDELEALAAAHERFSYAITLSRPPEAWTGLRGRLGESVPPLLPTLGGKRFYLVGNGAMLEEMALALSDMGVVQQHIYKEPYFDPVHQPDREVVAGIRERFVATDLFSAYAARRGSAFDIDRDIEAARTGKAGNGDPLAVSDLFELLPAFLSHHPDQEEPAPTQVERPWNRPG